MKNSIIALFLLVGVAAKAQYAPAAEGLKTRWADDVNPQIVLPEYPRPMMTRVEWKNLNGLWDYAITPKEAGLPTDFDGKILVPFCVESSLSGVMKTVGSEKALWYRMSFSVPKNWKGQRVLLHFGAVDWQADVWVNDIKVGSHTGGYTPFSIDITQALDAKTNT